MSHESAPKRPELKATWPRNLLIALLLIALFGPSLKSCWNSPAIQGSNARTQSVAIKSKTITERYVIEQGEVEKIPIEACISFDIDVAGPALIKKEKETSYTFYGEKDPLYLSTHGSTDLWIKWSKKTIKPIVVTIVKQRNPAPRCKGYR